MARDAFTQAEAEAGQSLFPTEKGSGAVHYGRPASQSSSEPSFTSANSGVEK